MVPTWQLIGISEHPSYHGTMTIKEAELKLKQRGNDHFLTRYSEVDRKYVLSVVKEGRCRHFDINIKKEKKGTGETVYEIGGTEKAFYNIFKLFDFYQEFPIGPRIDSIGDPIEYVHKRPSQEIRAAHRAALRTSPYSRVTTRSPLRDNISHSKYVS